MDALPETYSKCNPIVVLHNVYMDQNQLCLSDWNVFENNSELHDICWGIMNTYFMILWILPSGFGWNWFQTWRFILSTMCANDRNFRVSTGPLRPFLVLFVTTIEQKHRFLRVHFEAVISICGSGLSIMQRRGKLLVLSDRDPFFLGGVFSFFQISI